MDKQCCILLHKNTFFPSRLTFWMLNKKFLHDLLNNLQWGEVWVFWEASVPITLTVIATWIEEEQFDCAAGSKLALPVKQIILP